MSSLNFAGAMYEALPFPHLSVGIIISKQLEGDLLGWFETQAPWKISVQDFYEQYEFSFKDVEVPEKLRQLFSLESLNGLRETIGHFFNAPLSTQIDITAHKLNRTQKIRIHNDGRPQG